MQGLFTVICTVRCSTALCFTPPGYHLIQFHPIPLIAYSVTSVSHVFFTTIYKRCRKQKVGQAVCQFLPKSDSALTYVTIRICLISVNVASELLTWLRPAPCFENLYFGHLLPQDALVAEAKQRVGLKRKTSVQAAGSSGHNSQTSNLSQKITHNLVTSKTGGKDIWVSDVPSHSKPNPTWYR